MRSRQHILPADTQIPDHIAIILDGNGRWARARGMRSTEGHKAGYKAMRKVIEASRQLGVHTLTVWGFSTENWSRPAEEVQEIMHIVLAGLRDLEKEAHKEKVRFVHLGRKDRLPEEVREMIAKMEVETRKYHNHILNVALDYGGRDEILRATRKAIESGIPPEKLTEEKFSMFLDTHDQPYPYPDLFIRTSGEQRTSGFLPWQMAYTEFYWEEDHLPDMTMEKLKEAILDYSRRRRRFGGKDKVGHLTFKPQLTAKFEVAWWRLRKIPQGTKFVDYTLNHLREQYGLSKSLATQAATLLMDALLEGEKSKWDKASIKLRKFYRLIKDEIKLAFEPEIVASLELKLMQKDQKGSTEQVEVEDTTRQLLSEMYRISDFQAAKAAHLRALATMERTRAELSGGETHWTQAEDYLERYYKALKDRVA